MKKFLKVIGILLAVLVLIIIGKSALESPGWLSMDGNERT